ncbi:cathepsin B-like cysteine proteinase 6 [Melanaphis sacchari]|uniref:cathepsin B-like cysteine proteinase 6 n=1 Tax=Melanaphis sacchari TaxID=742174 RepID=UPI000DC131CC|nr:cathepsin B-like cysteine proteinase 6 [Melanaphis sacchari]
MARIIYLISVILLGAYLTEQLERANFLSHDYIDKINSVAKTWKAGANFDPNTPKEVILGLLGSRRIRIANDKNICSLLKTNDPSYRWYNRIHKKFDARKHWRRCKTIGAIRDQGNCGACWAFSTTGAFADRLCVATKGKYNQLMSAEELTFCCHTCGFGCYGGDPLQAWIHFKNHGVVSGGNYNTTDGCQPYQIAPCHHCQSGVGSCESHQVEKNHKCSKKCYGNKNINFRSDHSKTKNAYYLAFESIQKDVQTYGPVEASFDVYDDFLHYKSGVYSKTKNAKFLAAHSVKLIGWGVEHGVDYWLMVNSWGKEWGHKGLFKIRRGTNECGIDNSTTGGVPLI